MSNKCCGSNCYGRNNCCCQSCCNQGCNRYCNSCNNCGYGCGGYGGLETVEATVDMEASAAVEAAGHGG